MKDKSVAPTLEDNTPPIKSSRACFLKFIIPLCLSIIIGIVGSLTLLYRLPWIIANPHAQDIVILKNQVASLDGRINQLEGAEITPQPSVAESEHIKSLENSIASLQSQFESLQNQPKVEISPQHLERSQAFEKDLIRLTETSQVLKSAYLFLRLKTKVLSDAPYAAELNAFKASLKEPENLSILEKYADLGLQGLKGMSNDSPPPRLSNESSSWWERVKSFFGSIIKVEKIDTPISDSSQELQDRKAIEEQLAQLDRSLTDKLKSTSTSLSPQPGDPS